MPNDAESAIYTRLAAAPRFHPASADMFMPDWTLEAGDVVEVKSGESSYNVPVYSMNLNWKGSSRVTVQSTGNEKRDPISALKRKQYGAGAGAYRAQKNFSSELQEFETEISQTNYEISLRAYQRDMDNVDEILRQAGISINAYGVITYAEDNVNMIGSKFSVQAGQISSIVTKTGINNLSQNDTLYTKITQTENDITSIAQKTGVNSLGQGETLYSKISQNATNITTLVNKTGINDVGQNETLYSKISQNAGDITTLVTKTGINSLGTSDTLYSKISQTESDITSLVTKTGVNSLGQGETLYSEISQNATAITQKVSAGDISSTINQTAQSVLISASKINLSGYVTASDLSATNAEITGLKSGTAAADHLVTHLLSVYRGEVGLNAVWKSKEVVTGITLSGSRNWVYEASSGTQHTVTGYIVTATTTGTIYYLGRTDWNNA